MSTLSRALRILGLVHARTAKLKLLPEEIEEATWLRVRWIATMTMRARIDAAP